MKEEGGKRKAEVRGRSVQHKLPARNGFSVAIKRKDGSEFLACAGRGLLPYITISRSEAVRHKRELIAEHFKCRVVRALFADPIIWS